MPRPAPEVLGHLLLLQSTLPVMTQPRRLGECLCAGVLAVPGVGGCALFVGDAFVHSAPADWQPPQDADVEEKDIETLPLRTAFGTYGRMALHVMDREQLEPYVAFLENIANWVALLLETRAQNAALRQSRELLERRVEERTAELAALNRRLAEREHFVQKVCNTAPTLIYIFDLAQQRNVYCNDAAEALLGLSVTAVQAAGSNLLPQLSHTDDLVAIAAHQARWARASDTDVLEIEFRVQRRDKSWRTLHCYEVVFDRNKDGLPVRIAGVGIDVSERVAADRERIRLTEQLLHAQRIESIGRLAGGVAHDLNNLLMPILGLTHIVLEDLPADSSVCEDLRQIQNAAERCKQLTQQLLAFGRKQILDIKGVCLDDLVREHLVLLRRVLREHIVVEATWGEEPTHVLADAGQLGQVLVNLAVNAQDAMPSGGTLRITVGHGPSEVLDAHGIPGLAQCPLAFLTVEDTGCGMDQEVSEHAFDPFFTTKGPGRGTGLGLSIVQGIIAQHGGSITASSTPEKGSRFTVLLPLSDGSETRAAPGSAEVPSLEGTTVLVAEDESSVRATVVRMLQRMHARVLSAHSGEEALAVASAYPGNIDVLLTDLVMPGMSGVQLCQTLRLHRPHVHVLFVSGYPDTTLDSQSVPREAARLLAKPFSPAVLAQRLQELLAGHAAGVERFV